MGLFNFIGELITLPLEVASTTVKTVARGTGAALSLDVDEAEETITEAQKDAIRKLNKLLKSLK